MPEWLLVPAGLLSRALDLIPVPSGLSKALDRLRDRLIRVNKYAPLAAAAVAAVVVVRLVVELARIPLMVFWEFFGTISDNDTGRLAVYNTVVQILAFVVAVKVCYEIARGDR